jgi:hypothetical protein
VVVVMDGGGAGVVTLDCSEVVVVVVGDEPQPANTAMLAISAAPAI